MKDNYAVAEVAGIFARAALHTKYPSISDDVLRSLAGACLEQGELDVYFEQRLGLREITAENIRLAKELEKLGQDKASNDNDYLALSAQYGAAYEKIKDLETINDYLLSKLVATRSAKND